MNNNIRAINLSTNIEDINAYNFGEYNYGTKWVDYGKDNDYPYFLRTLYLNSPTNQAVIDNTINMATGEGVEVVDPAKNPISNKWLNENFPKDVVKKLLSDLKLYGYATAEVYGGSLIKYKEAIKFRMDQKDEHGRINNVWFSEDWDRYTYRKYQPVKLPIYYEGLDADVSILLFQLDKHGFDYYSPVDYNASINYIALEAEISKYHLSNIKNGLFPSFLITIVGTEFSDEQMEKIENNIQNKWGGSSNGGRGMVQFVSNKDDATQIETIDQPTLPDTYQFLTKEASEKILLGHGVTSPLLFGIRDTGGGLGSNSEELEKSFYLYYESKLKHYQNYILEGIKKVMNGNVMYAEVQFKTYNPFATTDKTQQLSAIDKHNEIDTQDILRTIELSAIKSDEIIVTNEKLFTNVNSDKVYKFIKSSKNNDLISKKFEMLSKKGYVFKANDLIKNTKDYFFYELSYIKNNK